MSAEPPTPQRIQEIIREGAGLVVATLDQMIGELDRVTLAFAPPEVSNDPVLAAELRRNNRANLLHWAQSNVRAPGAEVPANTGPESITIARDIVRRGLDDTALEPYRVGQNLAWRRWMEIVFSLTSDPEELRQVLDVTSQSIFAFVDATMSAIIEQIRHEREQLTRGTHAARLEVVSLILDGAPINRERAVTMLGYELDQAHTAAIIWSDELQPEQGLLDRAAAALGRIAGTRRPLTVVAATASLWAWIPGAGKLDMAALQRAMGEFPGVRIAVGPQAHGIPGFRRSHLDALATQRLLVRVGSGSQAASYDAVELVALVTSDEERSAEFVRRTLGALEEAGPELRETLLTYLSCGSNATETARRLYTHRNTVLGRLQRAQQLLPRPLADNQLAVAVALEVAHWRA
jgi:DNA-binding PucR family transcriptional regulator